MAQNFCLRAILPVTVAVTGFVVVCCLLLYSMIRTDLTYDAVLRSTSLADTVVKSMRYAMLKNDRDGVRNLIDNVGAQRGVKHVRVFNKQGLIAFSTQQRETGRFVDKNTAGCNGCHAGAKPLRTLAAMQQARHFVDGDGEEVLGVTAAIYNEPACSTAACHVHAAEQTILGILDFGLDQTPLNATLASLRLRMLVFSLMVLCLTVGGVAALLCRSIFLPLRELSAFAAAIEAQHPERIPPHVGGELAGLAGQLHRLHTKFLALEQQYLKSGHHFGKDDHGHEIAPAATKPATYCAACGFRAADPADS